jgi:hypothetical protein
MADKSQDYPPAEYHFESKSLVHVDFETSSYRKEVSTEIFNGNDGKFVPYFREYTFDGSTFKAFTPREKNTGNGYAPGPAQPDIFLGPKDLAKISGPFFEVQELPIVFAGGVIDFYPDPRTGLRAKLEPSDLSFQGYSLHNDRQCCIVRQTSQKSPGVHNEIWIDLERSARITRWVAHFPAYVYFDLRLEYKASEDIVPTSWKATAYLAKGFPDATYEYKVVNYAINKGLDSADLQLERKQEPGRVVQTYAGEREDFHTELSEVNWDGSLSPLRLDANGQVIRSRNWWKIGMWTGIAVVAIGGVCWLARSFLRKRKTV